MCRGIAVHCKRWRGNGCCSEVNSCALNIWTQCPNTASFMHTEADAHPWPPHERSKGTPWHSSLCLKVLRRALLELQRPEGCVARQPAPARWHAMRLPAPAQTGRGDSCNRSCSSQHTRCPTTCQEAPHKARACCCDMQQQQKHETRGSDLRTPSSTTPSKEPPSG